jgi:hypothetical protein
MYILYQYGPMNGFLEGDLGWDFDFGHRLVTDLYPRRRRVVETKRGLAHHWRSKSCEKGQYATASGETRKIEELVSSACHRSCLF